MKEVTPPNSRKNSPDALVELASAVADWFHTTRWEYRPRTRSEGPSLKVSWGTPARRSS